MRFAEGVEGVGFIYVFSTFGQGRCDDQFIASDSDFGFCCAYLLSYTSNFSLERFSNSVDLLRYSILSSLLAIHTGRPFLQYIGDTDIQGAFLAKKWLHKLIFTLPEPRKAP